MILICVSLTVNDVEYLPVYLHFYVVFDEVCVQVSGPFLLSYLFTYS